MSFSSMVAGYENFIEFGGLSREIHLRQLDKLKEHKDTIEIDPKDETYGFGEVVKYVAEETYCDEIYKVKMYLTTYKAVKSLNKFVRDEVKKELEKKDKLDKNLCLALENSINSFVSAKGFFSLHSNDVYIVKDIHLVGEEMRKKKEVVKEALKKKSKKKTTTKKKATTDKKEDSWKKGYGYKPKKYGHREWLRISMRSTLAHELFHYYMDLKSNTNDMMMQEEYAYGSMIGWMRKEGLKDNEIVKAALMWFGATVAASKDPSLTVKGREKIFKAAAVSEAKKLIERFDNQQRAKNGTKDERKNGFDHEDHDLLLEL